jgi:VWFA-related protein
MICRFLTVRTGILAAAGVVAQTAEAPEVRGHENAPSFRIRVETNLVAVPVVVRDRDGRPVGNLERKDFRLFDSGKLQEITGFKVEITNPKTTPEAAASPSANTPVVPQAAPTPQRFVTLFFDDFHMPIEDVARTRNAAWHYLSTAVRPEDRVAIFTSSAKEQLDFTDDRGKLHDTLFRLAPHSRTDPQMNQCPSIEEYQAYLIDHLQDTRALDIAATEGYECHCKGEGNETQDCFSDQMRQAKFDAGRIWGLADMQTQWTLEAIRQLLRRMAAMPGQRTLVLVSPGFLTMTRNEDVDKLVNQAVQQNIVINALDAAGLYTRSSRPGRFGPRLDLEVQKTGMENTQLEVARDVLAGLSAGTGGTYFRNSNDFDQGFRVTAQAPEVYYTLSFSPRDVKLDGKFHLLKVVLNNAGDHLRVEARRGYVAPQGREQEAARTQTEIEKLVFSLEELHGLPVEVTAQVEKGSPASTLTIKVHVDISVLHFRKDADRNIDTLIFETVLFDRDGKYVAAKEGSLDLRLKDANLGKFTQSGINAVVKFQVPPGTYRIRELVRDTESKDLAAVNYSFAEQR